MCVEKKEKGVHAVIIHYIKMNYIIHNLYALNYGSWLGNSSCLTYFAKTHDISSYSLFVTH